MTEILVPRVIVRRSAPVNRVGIHSFALPRGIRLARSSFIDPVYGGSSQSKTQELLLTNNDPAPVVSSGRPTPRVDRSDIPCDGQLTGGQRFEQQNCCETERTALIRQGEGVGKCRACGTTVTAKT